MASTSVVLISSSFVTILISQLLPESLSCWSLDELLLGQKIDIHYDADANVVHIDRTYLTMEPIISLFLIFCGVVVIFQFSAMAFHRLQRLEVLSPINGNSTERRAERAVPRQRAPSAHLDPRNRES
ncbi:hypothetical protein ABMA28_013596 [Loxostege sticticalis]|uniref:Uncharacterized protein n=1 Tax=Loxostege sticticalis TaxID=481309 RepID=A0ABD0TIV5_LOXSC